MNYSIRNLINAAALLAALGACAGRDPRQIAVVQPQDQTSDCMAINAQLAANQTEIERLRRESKNTDGGNVALGVAGALLFWPALFAMDFKDASGKEAAQLLQRQGYLQQLAAQRGCAPISPSSNPSSPEQAPAPVMQ